MDARKCSALIVVVLTLSFVDLQVKGLQIGPLTLPTWNNGGAFGISTRHLNSSIQPGAGASLSVHLPPSIPFAGGLPLFNNVISRFIPSSRTAAAESSASDRAISRFLPIASGSMGGSGETALSNVLSGVSNGASRFTSNTNDRAAIYPSIPAIPSAVNEWVDRFRPLPNGLSGNADTEHETPMPARHLLDRFFPSTDRRNFDNTVSRFVPSTGDRLATHPAIPAIPSTANEWVDQFKTLQNSLRESVDMERGTALIERILSSPNVGNVLHRLLPAISWTNLSLLIRSLVSPQFWAAVSSSFAPESTDRQLSNAIGQTVGKLSEAIHEAPSNHSAGSQQNSSNKDPHFLSNRNGIVHLFEWRFQDVALECEKVLGPNGFGGVQLSPVNENRVVPGRPWWERYQPVSYEIQSRSGNEKQLADMVQRCNAAGVRVYVDIVANHMAARGPSSPIYGTAGSIADPCEDAYPAVPYNRSHFHRDCTVQGDNDAAKIRNCAVGDTPDLNQTDPYVRERIQKLMNQLIDHGVAGFRMDAARYMDPKDLQAIYEGLHLLSPLAGFPVGAKPFIYQHVLDVGEGPIKSSQYMDFGVVTEYKWSLYVAMIFQGQVPVALLERLTKNLSSTLELLPSDSALVFVDSYDNQRGYGANRASILTFNDKLPYIQAVAFTLATDYGIARLMSSYEFTSTVQGPPDDELESIRSPGFTASGGCENGWICEHRWPEVLRMQKFRSLVGDAPLTNVQMTNETFAFCRGTVGFVAFNVASSPQTITLRTCLPAGEYCDLMTGQRNGSSCSGTSINVDGRSLLEATIPPHSTLAFNVANRVQ